MQRYQLLAYWYTAGLSLSQRASFTAGLFPQRASPSCSHSRPALPVLTTAPPRFLIHRYTLFFLSETTGMPTMRPLWVHFPELR